MLLKEKEVYTYKEDIWKEVLTFLWPRSEFICFIDYYPQRYMVIFQHISMIWMSGSLYNKLQQNKNYHKGFGFVHHFGQSPPPAWLP